MARKFIHDYIFTASTSTVQIKGWVPLDKILMITNLTDGVVIQQFASPDTGILTHSYDQSSTAIDSVDGVTTIGLEYDCTTMSNSDTLQIIVEEEYQTTRPWHFGTDAIERQRISIGESLIDADFEYGLQATKWATFTMVNNLPGVYEKPGQDIQVSDVTTDNTSPYSVITVTATAHGLSNGEAFTISGLRNSPPTSAQAEGAFLVKTINSNSFYYYAKGYVGPANNTSLYTQTTIARAADFFQYSAIDVSSITSDAADPSTITVNTTDPHGLFPGHTLIVSVSSANATNYHDLMEGNFFVEQTTAANSFTFTARTGGGVLSSGITATVRSRPDGFNVHRPFDGGVLIGTDSPACGAMVLRQSKQYFRYQSGKGMLFTSGTLLQPNYDVESVTASGTTVGSAITITTEQTHGLQAGAGIALTDIDTTGYNGSYTVVNIISEKSFTVTATAELGSTTGTLGQQPRISVSSWHGASIRAGMFDDQNGMFYESDGQKVYVVKRSGTFQLAGTVTVANNSADVYGLSTRFGDQVRPGDRIVVRGQVKVVSSVSNTTHLTISPPFSRSGSSANVVGLKISKILETRIAQENWNIDKLDGTGPSGFTFEKNKMQMLGIQYSWYGAGFIDFLMRGRDGNFVTAHRIKNNNVNDEAYLRSGNLPARYEVINSTPPTYLTAAANSTVTTLEVANNYYLPSSGTIAINNELISYTSKVSNNSGYYLTSCTRAASLSQYSGGSTRTFDAGSAAAHSINDGVILVSTTCAPTLSHWGSSVIMDGNFNLDRGYFFNYGEENGGVTGSSTKTVFLVRLAPTVSNGIAGNFGQRELINRALILLQKIEIITNRDTIVSGILNPSGLSGITWQNLNQNTYGSQPSFVQISNSFTGTAAPGEQIFSTIASRAGGITTFDLTELKALGNGVIGGDNQFPDGPDVLAINLTNTDSQNATVQTNLFWTETQA